MKATLTSDENRAWVSYFTFYLEDGKTDDEADRLAWLEMQQEFPRLREYEGAQP